MGNVFEVNSKNFNDINCVFIVNFQQISHIHLVSQSVTLSK